LSDLRFVINSDGSLGAAESARPYHTKLRILFSYFLIKKCLRYFSSNPNNNLNYNFHFCLVPNYIVLCTVCFVNTHISTYKYLNASRIVLIKKKMCVNKNPLNKHKILLNINYDVCSPSSFFLISSVKTNLNYILKLKLFFHHYKN
jgi:hypothetical protein